MNHTLRHLAAPGRIGTMHLRNRMVQAPAYTLMASAEGEVTDRLTEYFRERARGGVGLIITENTAIDWEQGRAAGNPLRIDQGRFRAGLSQLVEAVHAEGAKIAVQLHHAGRQAIASNTVPAAPPVAPSAGPASMMCDPPRALAVDEIRPIIDKYATAARHAVAAGFDAVEIHGAHGYLPQQFLSPKTNLRTDAYGGSFKNRARFGLELVQAVREAVGPHFPIIYRASIFEPYDGGLTLDEGVAYCVLISPHVDCLDISAGNYDTGETVTWMGEPGGLLGAAEAVRAQVDIPVIGVGRLAWALEAADRAVGKGALDFVSLARGQLADPWLVEKELAGRTMEVRRCIACNECAVMMGTGRRTQCVINPELGREAEARDARRNTGPARKVLVVGGGPAGCEAARLLAIRGHDTTLVEREHALGGQLRAAAALPSRRLEYLGLIDFYASELRRTGVNVRLGVRVEASDFDAYDIVLLATGSNPAAAPPGAIRALDMLQSGTVPAHGSVDVQGQDCVALTAALWLAAQGKDVRVHAAGEPFGAGWNLAQIGMAAAMLQQSGVVMLTDTAPPQAPSGWVWSGGSTPDTAYEDQVDHRRILPVGERARGGRLYEATQSGYWAAARI